MDYSERELKDHDNDDEEIYEDEVSKLEVDFGFLPYVKEAEKLGWLLNMQPVGFVYIMSC